MEKTLLGWRIDDLHACDVEILTTGVLYHGIHNNVLTKMDVHPGLIFWKRDTRENQEWYDFVPATETGGPYYRKSRQ